ncbi:hypothetical protein [Azospirillum picis]|uniref:Uncharacterized protein n=1 Tax=Azospirillum picis TaxID=488438 RepID=A0ABU0MKP8_9PROT|nr:hypothetical protein [Azospirillum picis]MBP2300123.1 hypothetical protein [Azospirillum picis]MDQ0534035.1 hypothetical protein [Azospirillum picis]
MSTRMEFGLRTLVLALYEEAAITAAAKGLTGSLGALAVLRETASLASARARRPVTEEEVLGAVLHARRAQGRIRTAAGADPRLAALPVAPVLSGSVVVPSPAGSPLAAIVLDAPADAAMAAPLLSASEPAKPRRGRLALWALRSLGPAPTAALI